MTSKKSTSGKSDIARSEVRISVADQVRELTIETTSDRDEVLEMIKQSLATRTLRYSRTPICRTSDKDWLGGDW
jgi:hypothetical protein